MVQQVPVPAPESGAGQPSSRATAALSPTAPSSGARQGAGGAHGYRYRPGLSEILFKYSMHNALLSIT